MSARSDRQLRFEIKGDLAVAAYYLMANWPNPDTAPEVESSGGPLAISFDGGRDALKDLRDGLQRISSQTGLLATSAQAWLRELDARQAQEAAAEGASPSLRAN